MNESGTVDGVLAIVTGIVMTTADVNWTRIDKWVKTGSHIFQLWGGVTRIVFIVSAFLCQRLINRSKFRRNIGHLDSRGMARLVSKPGEGHGIFCSAPLVVNA